ncbi:MAG: hypothetical protein OEM28_06260 [Nitrosopumilus sp.]|nr:hypothetical protein [Nitrosopumilus sp.]MDH3488603.1 hypothetical protein [Nitrosopumilus sp.]
MNRFLFLIPLLFTTGVGYAYAEPLDQISTKILEFNDNTAIVQISWNQDESISQYEVGCVSCSPNISEATTQNSIILDELTSIGEKFIILLYVIAYDSENEIINAVQIFVELK